MLTQDESSNTSYLYLSGMGQEEVYVITLVYRTIHIKNSVNSHWHHRTDNTTAQDAWHVLVWYQARNLHNTGEH